MSVHILGVDLGKNFCSVVGVDMAGEVILRRSMRRPKLIDFIAQFQHHRRRTADRPKRRRSLSLPVRQYSDRGA